MKKITGKRSIVDIFVENNETYISYMNCTNILRAINYPEYSPWVYLMPLSSKYFIDSVIGLRLICYWIEYEEKDPELLKKLKKYLSTIKIFNTLTWCDYISLSERSWDNIVSDAYMLSGIDYKNNSKPVPEDSPYLYWLGEIPENLDDLPYLIRYEKEKSVDEEVRISDKMRTDNVKFLKDKLGL